MATDEQFNNQLDNSEVAVAPVAAPQAQEYDGDVWSATPEQLNQLVETGYVTPVQAKRISEVNSNKYAQGLRDEEAANVQSQLATQKINNPAQYAQDAQQGADTIEQIAMKGTGIGEGFTPIVTPPSPVGTPFTGLPSTLQAPAQSPVEEIQAQEMAKATREAAAENAAQALQREQLNKQLKTQQDLQQQNTQTEEKVAADLKNSGSNIFKGIGDALAIMLGAYSQGLTGNKENPGLKAVESRIEREAQQRKYKADEEAALTKLVIDAAKMRLDKMKQDTDNVESQHRIAKLQAEISGLGQQNKAAQDLTALSSQREVDESTLFAMSNMGEKGKELAREYVMNPLAPGKYIKVTGGPTATDALNKYMTEVGGVPEQVNKIIEYAKSPEFSRLSPEERGVMHGKIIALVGKLRLPFLGPGPMTQTEFDRLAKVIGSPNDWITMKNWEVAKLDNIKTLVEDDIGHAYKVLGRVSLKSPGSEVADRTTRVGKLINGVSEERVKKALERADAKNPKQK